jgi:hypothetical protein
VGGGSGSHHPQIVPARNGVGISAANAPVSLGGNSAGAHGTIFAANTVFAEFTVGGLFFYPVFPGFRASCAGPLPQFGGNFLHLLYGSHIFQCFCQDNPPQLRYKIIDKLYSFLAFISIRLSGKRQNFVDPLIFSPIIIIASKMLQWQGIFVKQKNF